MYCNQFYYPHVGIFFRDLKKIKKIIITMDFSSASCSFKQKRKEILSILDETIDNIANYKVSYNGENIKRYRSYINKLCKKSNKLYKLIFSLRKIEPKNSKRLNAQIKAFILASNCVKHLMYDNQMLSLYS